MRTVCVCIMKVLARIPHERVEYFVENGAIFPFEEAEVEVAPAATGSSVSGGYIDRSSWVRISGT